MDGYTQFLRIPPHTACIESGGNGKESYNGDQGCGRDTTQNKKTRFLLIEGKKITGLGCS